MVAYPAASFLILLAIVLWHNLQFGVFGSTLMVGWDNSDYVALANALYKNGIQYTIGTWSYPQLYVQILAVALYLGGNITVAERVFPLALGFLSIYAVFLIVSRISGNIHIAGLSSILQASSISFLKIVSDNNRNLMALSLAFVALLVVQGAWSKQPRVKDYLVLTILTLAIAFTQFETFAILSLTMMVAALLTLRRQNISLSATAVGVPSVISVALFPAYFLTYFQTPIQTPKQSLSSTDLTYWTGGSALLLFIFAVGCAYAFLKWKKNGSILSLLVFVWTMILLAIFGGVWLLHAQAELGVRALLLAPSYIMIPFGAMLIWLAIRRILQTKNLPVIRQGPRRTATILMAVLIAAIVLANSTFAVPGSGIFFNTFIPATTYNKIAYAANYVRENSLGVPIIVFSGTYSYAALSRSYLGALVGEDFAYYGSLDRLLELQPTFSNSSDPSKSASENYLSQSYLQELMGKSPGPTEFVHRSYITNTGALLSHAFILITPDLYNSYLPGVMFSFRVGHGIYVIPPHGLDNLGRTMVGSNVTIFRDNNSANLPGVYDSVDPLNSNHRYITVNASRGFESYNVTSFPSSWRFLGVDQAGNPSTLDFSPMRPNGVPAIVGNDYADSVQGWTPISNDSTISLDHVARMEGNSSIKVSGIRDPFGNVGLVLALPQTDYVHYDTISFWAKCISCSLMTVNLVDTAGQPRTFYDVGGDTAGPTSQYRRFSVLIDMPSGGNPEFGIHSVSSISFLAHSGNQSAMTLWIDDVVVQKNVPNPSFLYKGRVLRTDEVDFHFEETLQASADVPETLPILTYPAAFDLWSFVAATTIFILCVGLIDQLGPRKHSSAAGSGPVH